jgi:hypothetical protein
MIKHAAAEWKKKQEQIVNDLARNLFGGTDDRNTTYGSSTETKGTSAPEETA